MKLKTNVGIRDRWARLAVAAAATILAQISGVGTVLGVLLMIGAVVLATTAVVRFCPAYASMGLSTCRVPPAGPPLGRWRRGRLRGELLEIFGGHYSTTIQRSMRPSKQRSSS